MRPLEKVYWLRLGLGFLAALLCIGYEMVTPGSISPTTFELSTLFTGASIAIIVYMLSYYAIKYRFMNFVQKPGKLVTTGVGIYFLSWLVSWILLYTIIAGPAP